MTLIRMETKLHAELIFIWKVSHLDLFETEGQENSEMTYMCISSMSYHNKTTCILMYIVVRSILLHHILSMAPSLAEPCFFVLYFQERHYICFQNGSFLEYIILFVSRFLYHMILKFGMKPCVQNFRQDSHVSSGVPCGVEFRNNCKRIRWQ